MKRVFVLSLLAGMVATMPVGGQQTHVLIISGLGGTPQYRKLFTESAALLADSARARWHVTDSSLIVLAEDSALDPSRISGLSTRANVASAFLRLSRRVKPGDVLLVFLNGHGSGEGAASRVNLPGPDPTAADYASWLAGFSRQTVVFVNAASGSGDFVPVLRGPGRVIVTATKTTIERNEVLFAAPFVRGLTTSAADADKDGHISVMEAFEYATREVARAYETDHMLQTEHAVLSDSTLARTVAFDGARPSNDPRVIALVAERQALETNVAALRARKAAMDSVAYAHELERLLLLIAEKSRAIRAIGGSP